MHLHFYGHAAFKLTTNHTRIIFDPYRSPDSGGYAPIADPADIVAVSHDNDRYHSHLGQIAGPFDVVRGPDIPPEGTTVRGLTFHAVPVFETPERLPGDEVTILHFRTEGLHVVHLGDLGHRLEPDELAPIQNADIVLCPAGGPPTLDFPDIPHVLAALAPKVVIPMHYKTPGINLAIQPRERFLDACAPLSWPVLDTRSSDLSLTRDTLPTSPTILLLDPSR